MLRNAQQRKGSRDVSFFGKFRVSRSVYFHPPCPVNPADDPFLLPRRTARVPFDCWIIQPQRSFIPPFFKPPASSLPYKLQEAKPFSSVQNLASALPLSPSTMISSLAYTLILSHLLWTPILLVQAGNVTYGNACNIAHNRLSPDTKQFTGDCTATTFCSSNGTCLHKGCRRDEYPFGSVQRIAFRRWLVWLPAAVDGVLALFLTTLTKYSYKLFSNEIPHRCPSGEFCPDEEDECQTLLPIDSPCQLNRDGERSRLPGDCPFKP